MFVTVLFILVRDCEYDMLENRMLRDAIVLQSKHPAVMEKCCNKGENLTLDMAINNETSQESIRTVDVDQDKKLDIVKKFKYKSSDSRNKGQEESEVHTPERKGECRRRGYGTSHRNCPRHRINMQLLQETRPIREKVYVSKTKSPNRGTSY